MLPALVLASILSTQEQKANDDRDVLNAAFQGSSSSRFLGRLYYGERGTFWSRIQRLAASVKPSAKELLNDSIKNGKMRKRWDLICTIREHIEDEVEKAPPPVVPILELGLTGDIRFTVHDTDLYSKDQVKYSRQITEYFREKHLIDYPTPPAYSASGCYAILTYRFGDIRHEWFSTLVLEKVNVEWKVILKAPSNWVRAD